MALCAHRRKSLSRTGSKPFDSNMMNHEAEQGPPSNHRDSAQDGESRDSDSNESALLSNGWISVVPALLTPVCIGMSLYFLLAWAINEGHLTDETALRYLTGHPVSKVTLGMFFIGSASLLLIAYNIYEQFGAEQKITLSDLPDVPTPNADSSIRSIEDEVSISIDHGQQMLDLPRWTHKHYLWNRLVKTLHYIYRNGSVTGVEAEMKYLAELDLERSHQRYSLVRILIWATPMLGFLGTVLGISQALGGISVGPDNDFQAMMGGLQSNLYVAFDTTALALTLSMVLMFGQFLVERFEIQLLQLVDQRTSREISNHYDMTLASSANGSFEKIGREVLEATRDVVVDQTRIWKQTISAAEQAWTASLTQTNDLVRSNLSAALDENVANLADYLGQAIEKADLSVAHRWEQWQTMLSENARLMRQHQEQMIAQTKNVHELVGKVDNSSSFKEALAQQENAIQATTQMQQVLAKVAQEIAGQGGQLKQQTVNQAKLVKNSSNLIEQSSEAFQKRIEAFQAQITAATPNQPANTKTIFKVLPAKKADPQSEAIDPARTRRKRDPNKPVMFMRSEEVTAMRNQTKAPQTTAATAPTETKIIPPAKPIVARPKPMVIKPTKRRFFVANGSQSVLPVKPVGSPAPAEKIKPAKIKPAAANAAMNKSTISIDSLKTQTPKTDGAAAKSDTIMPDRQRMEDRRRARQRAAEGPASIPFSQKDRENRDAA